MARIFLSYSRTDEAFARQLATSLSELGADVWIDLEDIPVGMKWSRAIQEGLDVSDVLLVIISPESMASHNVEDEWQYYLDQKKPVIPLLLKPTKLHFQLSRIQYISFERQSYDKALRQLHTELGRKGVHLDPLPRGRTATQQVARVSLPSAPAASPSGRQLPVMWLALGAALLIVGVGLGIFLSNPNRTSDATTQPPGEPTTEINPTATPEEPTPDDLSQQSLSQQQQLPTTDPYSQSQLNQGNNAVFDDGDIQFSYPAGWLVERDNSQGSNDYLIASSESLLDVWKNPQDRRAANIPDGQFAALIVPNISSGTSNLNAHDMVASFMDSLAQTENFTFGDITESRVPSGTVTSVVGADTTYHTIEIMLIDPPASDYGVMLIMGWAAEDQTVNFVTGLEVIANSLMF